MTIKIMDFCSDELHCIIYLYSIFRGEYIIRKDDYNEYDLYRDEEDWLYNPSESLMLIPKAIGDWNVDK